MWVGAFAVVQLVAAHGSSVVGALGRNSQVVGSPQCWVGNRNVSRSGRCMRLGEGENRSLLAVRHSALLGGRSAVRLEVQARAYCSRVWRWMFVGGAKTGRAFGQPGGCKSSLSFIVVYTHLLRLCVCRQPVWIEALVVCHSGVRAMEEGREGEGGCCRRAVKW